MEPEWGEVAEPRIHHFTIPKDTAILISLEVIVILTIILIGKYWKKRTS